MKTAISVPDPIFSRADQFARRRKMSRSALFTVAVSQYLDRNSEEDVTDRLNHVYADESSDLDPAVAEAQRLLLAEECW